MAAELKRVCLLFALAREWHWFAITRRRRLAGGPCRAWSGWVGPCPVQLLQTGVGAAATRSALDWALGRTAAPPDLVVAAGFAGALAEGLPAGELVLADRVLDPDGTAWPALVPGGPTGVQVGAVVSTEGVLAGPAEKGRLGRELGALAVDMESAAAARLCAARGIPFVCVRAISDRMDTPISGDLAGLLAGGEVRPWPFLRLLLRRPGRLAEMLALARDTRTAGVRLGAWLAERLRRGWVVTG